MMEHPEDYVGRYARITSPRQTDSGAYFQPAFVALHEDYPTTTARTTNKGASTVKRGATTDERTPVSGPEALAHALSRLDVDQLEAEARADLESGKVTRRRPAVEKLRVLRGLRRNRRTPADLIVRQVPVIPAAFRPFSFLGETYGGRAGEAGWGTVEAHRQADGPGEHQPERQYGRQAPFSSLLRGKTVIQTAGFEVENSMMIARRHPYCRLLYPPGPKP